jgi:hypothetical protein
VPDTTSSSNAPEESIADDSYEVAEIRKQGAGQPNECISRPLRIHRAQAECISAAKDGHSAALLDSTPRLEGSPTQPSSTLGSRSQCHSYTQLPQQVSLFRADDDALPGQLDGPNSSAAGSVEGRAACKHTTMSRRERLAINEAALRNKQ